MSTQNAPGKSISIEEKEVIKKREGRKKKEKEEKKNSLSDVEVRRLWSVQICSLQSTIHHAIRLILSSHPHKHFLFFICSHLNLCHMPLL